MQVERTRFYRAEDTAGQSAEWVVTAPVPEPTVVGASVPRWRDELGHPPGTGMTVIEDCFECGELDCRSPQDCAAMLAQRTWVVCATCRGQRWERRMGAWVVCDNCSGFGIYEVGELFDAAAPDTAADGAYGGRLHLVGGSGSSAPAGR